MIPDVAKRLSPKDDPWFAKLAPRRLRGAMRAKSHRPAPRAYEDRLKHYFENIEN